MNVFDLTFTCPDLKTQSDAEIIRESILASPGVGDVTIDHVNQTVHVVTANQDGGADVRARLFRSGFPPDLG